MARGRWRGIRSSLFRLELLQPCGCWVVIYKNGGRRPAEMVEVVLWKHIQRLEKGLNDATR